jgi:Zn-dependent peptidase ImmA (M78 family)
MKKLEDEVNSNNKLPNLTLKDFVDILADGYHVETLRMVSNYNNNTSLCGIHIDEGDKKEILINKDMPLNERRETILHEFYHALYSRLGRKQSEKEVESLAQKKYKELYRDDSNR